MKPMPILGGAMTTDVKAWMVRLQMVVLLIFPSAALAANWDGDAGSGNGYFSWWDNWYGNTFPAFDSSTPLYFSYNNTSQAILTQDSGWRAVQSVIYESTFTGDTTLGGSDGLDLYWKIENLDTGSHAINAPISVKGAAFEINPLNGNLTIGGMIYNDPNRTLQVYGSGGHTLTMNSVLGGTGGLTVEQNSIVVLSNHNTYNGNSTVSAGTLLVSGSISNSAVTVASGATLRGTGTIGVLTNSGTVAPGNAAATAGDLKSGNIVLQAGGTYVWDITNATGAAGTGWDLITSGGGSGTVAADATSGSPFTIKVTGTPTNFNGLQSNQWTLIDSGAVSGFATNEFKVDTSAFGGWAPGTWSVVSNSGDLKLQYAINVSNRYGGAYTGWPTSNWTAISCLNDSDDGATEQWDIVGDASNPAVFYASDSNYFFLRVQVDNGAPPAGLWAGSMLVLFKGPDGFRSGVAWDYKSNTEPDHGLELMVTNGDSDVIWGDITMNDADTNAAKKVTPPDFCLTCGEGYIRTVEGVATTNFGTASWIDYAVSWNVLTNRTSLRPGQAWQIQIGTIDNATDHNAISTDVAGSNSPSSAISWCEAINLPTRVVLYTFTAEDQNGEVVVRWRTASEENTVGFYVERLEGGEWVQVNPSIVYSAGADGFGASYSLVDAGAEVGGTYTYRLVEVESDGVEIYGPFERTAMALEFVSPIAIDPNGVLLRWLSRVDETYQILRSTNLVEGFRAIASGIPATPPENEYLDQNPGPIGIYLIRVDDE